jgi:drug/metabolite transporter (DMT)-like permease
MEDSVLGIVLAIWASTNLNLGKGLQKWKVKIWGRKGAMFKRENLPDLAIWCCGLLLTASTMPLLSLAMQNTDKSSMVSAMNGVGLIGLVIFAWLVLKERIGWRELGGAALVISGSLIMGWFDKAVEGGQQYSLNRFLVVVAVIVAVMTPIAIWSWKTNKLFGLVFGSIPGLCVGVAMILADMALVKSGNSFTGQLLNPYPYAAFLLGVAATVTTQLAFWRAKAMVVIPTFNSLVMLSPLVIEYFTFGISLQPMQYLGIGISIGGVIILTATEKQDRIEGGGRRPEAATA